MLSQNAVQNSPLKRENVSICKFEFESPRLKRNETKKFKNRNTIRNEIGNIFF